MVFKIKNIRSIGWLNNAGDTVRLCPIFEGQSMPNFVTIKRTEFAKVRHCDEKMKELAIAKLNAA
jgi:hypothetical protein